MKNKSLLALVFFLTASFARAGLLELRVPAESEVYLSGTATTPRGSVRLFEFTDDLKTGYKYYYTIKVVLPGNFSETRDVYVTAGEKTVASFFVMPVSDSASAADLPVGSYLSLKQLSSIRIEKDSKWTHLGGRCYLENEAIKSVELSHPGRITVASNTPFFSHRRPGVRLALQSDKKESLNVSCWGYRGGYYSEPSFPTVRDLRRVFYMSAGSGLPKSESPDVKKLPKKEMP